MDSDGAIDHSKKRSEEDSRGEKINKLNFAHVEGPAVILSDLGHMLRGEHIHEE
jgi:hypothetical protein